MVVIRELSQTWKAASEKETLLDEAIESANAAAFDWISVELSEEVPELPPITDPDDMELEDEDVVRNIQVNIRLYDGWDE